MSCVFGRGLKKREWSVAAGVTVAGLLRYLCSFLSGIIIWREYAPETMPVWQTVNCSKSCGILQEPKNVF